MKKTFVMGCAALVAAACGGNNVERAKKMADEVCACKDAKCADEADERGENEMLKHLPRHLSDGDKAEIKKQRDRAGACLDDLLKKPHASK